MANAAGVLVGAFRGGGGRRASRPLSSLSLLIPMVVLQVAAPAAAQAVDAHESLALAISRDEPGQIDQLMAGPGGPGLRMLPAASLFDLAGKSGVCRERTTAALVRHQFRPAVAHVAGATFAGCSKVVRVLARAADPAMRAEAVHSTIALIDSYISMGGSARPSRARRPCTPGARARASPCAGGS